MLESHLWLVNHLGSVFTLGTFHRKFRQLQNTWEDGVNVKRLSASHWCAWAIGHDHRVYIYIHASDVPIRVPETTYENQVLERKIQLYNVLQCYFYVNCFFFPLMMLSCLLQESSSGSNNLIQPYLITTEL